MATVSSTGPRVNIDNIAERLENAGDGATILPTGLDYRGSGYVVAVPAHSYVILNDGSVDVAREVRHWVRNVATFVDGPNLRRRAFGAWTHKGDVYLDVVEIFSDLDREDAIAAGVARNQIAVWDAGRGVEVATGGTGD